MEFIVGAALRGRPCMRNNAGVATEGHPYNKSYRVELVAAVAGPGGILAFRYRVSSPIKCFDVPVPSEIECDRFGYENIENCLFAAIRALINDSVPW